MLRQLGDCDSQGIQTDRKGFVNEMAVKDLLIVHYSDLLTMNSHYQESNWLMPSYA